MTQQATHPTQYHKDATHKTSKVTRLPLRHSAVHITQQSKAQRNQPQKTPIHQAVSVEHATHDATSTRRVQRGPDLHVLSPALRNAINTAPSGQIALSPFRAPIDRRRYDLQEGAADWTDSSFLGPRRRGGSRGPACTYAHTQTHTHTRTHTHTHTHTHTRGCRLDRLVFTGTE